MRHTVRVMRAFDLPNCSVAAGMLLLAWWGLFEFWTNVVMPAREAARRTQCKNNMYQHSGCHFGDSVVLDANNQVIRVSSCPTCSSPSAPVYFSNENGDSLDAHSFSWETMLQARVRIDAYKASPWYRRAYRPGNVPTLYSELPFH